MPSQTRSLCIFGDSHLGSVRRALDEGLIDLTGFEVEFWGADGPNFRDIDIEGDTVRPQTDDALKWVRTINGNGRETLGPGDFDVYLFYGARLRLTDIMPPYLDILCNPDAAVSEAVLSAAVNRFISGRRSARIARHFADSGGPRVFFCPASFLADGVVDPMARQGVFAQFPHAEKAGEAERARLWRMIDAIFGESGVTVLRQPEDTIVRGCLTDGRYAVQDAVAQKDAVHKSPEFGARMLAEFLKAAT